MMYMRQYCVWLKRTADQNGMKFTLYVASLLTCWLFYMQSKFIVRTYASYFFEHNQVERWAFCETVLAATQRVQNTHFR